MTRTLYDSIDINAIPADAAMVGGYVDGHYPTYPSLAGRFPHAVRVSITVLGTAGAMVADCENGDLTPQSAAQWAKREIEAGRHPSIYTSADNWQNVRNALGAIGVQMNQVSFWIAQYDGVAQIPGGAVAKQYESNTQQNLDYSVVADYWPGVDPAPTPPPAPAPTYTPIQGDPEVAQRITATITTDPNGNGDTAVGVDPSKVVSVLVEGFDPQTAGTYWHDAGVSFTGDSTPGQTLVSIANSDVKGGNVSVVVWAAA